MRMYFRLAIFVSLLAAKAFAEFSAPCPFADIPGSFQPAARKVKITVLGARVSSSIDSDPLIFEDRADISGTVTLGGTSSSLPLIEGSDAPVWSSGNVFEKTLESGSSTMEVSIALLDEDGALSGASDQVDINPDASEKEIKFTIDTCSLRISVAGSSETVASQGPITFRGTSFTDSDFGEIDLRVEFSDGRPATTDDIALTELQAVQVIHNDLNLVSDKPFIVMARVANNFSKIIDSEIEISVSGAGISRTDRFPILGLKPGEVRRAYYYTDSPLVPSVSEPSLLSLTARVDPDGKHSFALAADDCRRRNDYIGDEPSDGLQYPTVRTQNQYIHWVKITPFNAVGDASSERYRNLAKRSSDLAQAMYPVATVGRNIDDWSWTPGISAGILDFVSYILDITHIPFTAATPFTTLFEMNIRAALGGVRKYVGVLHREYLPSLPYDLWENTPGVSLGTFGSRAVLVSEGWTGGTDPFNPTDTLSSVTLPVHELGHTYGLSVEPTIKDTVGCGITDPLGIGTLWCGIGGGYDEYTHPNSDLRDGFPATGYFVNRAGLDPAIAEIANNELCDVHGIMGATPRGDLEMWPFGLRRRWIDRANYQALFAKLFLSTLLPGLLDSKGATVIAKEHKEVDSFVFAGAVDFQDNVLMLPFWRVGSRVPDRDESDTIGLYQLRYRDAEGKILSEIGLPLDWVRSEIGTVGIPITFFSHVLPYKNGTKSIELLNRSNDKVIFTRAVSRSRPTVKWKTAPSAFSTRAKKKFRFEWSADDPDLKKKFSDKKARERKLYYSVLVRDPKDVEEPDAWRVVEMNSRRTSALLDLTQMPSTEYLIKIAVSDGVNSSESTVRRLRIQGEAK